MSSSYSIDFSEPLRTGFQIPAGGYNGPGGTASTSLRLHGRGALEWGEGVNEDLVRITENFASATPPLSPASGQLWTETKLYYRIGAGPTYAWYVYSYDTLDWSVIPSVDSTTGQPTTTGTLNQSYAYDSTTGILWGYHIIPGATVGGGTADWIERRYTARTSTAPTTESPEQTVKVYNKFTDTWQAPQSVTVGTSADAPVDPVDGTLWYDPSTKTLYVWDSSAATGFEWQAISTSGSATNLTLGSNQVTFNHMFLNEGDGDSINTGPDVRFTSHGLLAAESDIRMMVDSDNDTVGNFVVSKGGLTQATGTDLLTVYNTGEVRSNVANYETLVTDDNSLTNKLYVDTAVSGLSSLGTASSYDVGSLAGNIPLVSDIVGKHTIWIPAGALVSRASAGASLSTIETSVNKVNFKVLSYDASTQEHAQLFVQMPDSWNESTVTLRFVWSHPTTTINYSVVWGVQAVSLSSGDLLDVAFGAAETVTSVGGTADTLYRSSETTPLVIGGSPAQGDVVVFQIYRKAADGADTLAVDARLHGVAIYYTTDALNDA